jgi:predicted dehydrogenase
VNRTMTNVRLMTLDPGHFHAALVQKFKVPGASDVADVYAPLGPDLASHLGRIIGFNTRKDGPTDWRLEVHAGPDFQERMFRERPGNVVVLSGRNDLKIDRIKAAVEAGLHVLSDKPWIIRGEDFPKLKSALETARKKGVIAYDIMTERFEATSLLQSEFLRDPEVFGTQEAGTREEPGVFMESVHYLMKLVAGVPNRRPPWYFDVRKQGEGLTDVGTHLVDLVQWQLFPGSAIDPEKDVRVLWAERKPTMIPLEGFKKVTGEPGFPDYLAGDVGGGELPYYCNTHVGYSVRGVHAKLHVLWDFEQPMTDGDRHFAVYRGTRSRVEVRQTREQKFRPELYVVPVREADLPGVKAAAGWRTEALQKAWPGVALREEGRELRIEIPDLYRTGHEAHFTEVFKKFLGFLEDPSSLPAWEESNLLAKYRTTTWGVDTARKG